MREYSYCDIVKIQKKGITFFDNYEINFEECRQELAKRNKCLCTDTSCVAMRFIEKEERYFIFYSKERVQLNFKFSDNSTYYLYYEYAPVKKHSGGVGQLYPSVIPRVELLENRTNDNLYDFLVG